MNDRAFVMVTVKGIGACLTNDERRAHLIDLSAAIISVQESLPPEEK